ncbi:hypothetical protein D3C80_1128740 [compost metagenome]
MHGQQRFSRPSLVDDEQPQHQHRTSEQRQHLGTAPRMALADLGDAQQQCCQPDDHQHGAQVVDDRFALRNRQAHQRAMGHQPGTQAQRQVDQEHPAPGQVFGHVTAEHRAGHAGHGIHAAEIALIPAALPWRHDVTDDRLAHRNHPAGPDALEDSRQYQLFHALCHAAEHRRQGEQAHAEQHQLAPPVQVAQFAVDRHRHGHGHHVAGNHPGQQADVLELRGNGRHRNGDDGLVQRTEKDRQHQGDQHAANGRFGRFRLVEIGHGKTCGQ